MTGPEHWSEAELLLNESSCEYGCPHSGCPHEMRLVARAQVHATLALAATAEDTRRLDAIRAVLAAFDWEKDDRQLALEAIERITDGGQP
jgi:hypothetical protein